MVQKERLEQFFAFRKITARQFLIKCGLYPTYLTTLKGDVSDKCKEKIQKAFPELNVDWVNTGDGEMLIKGFRPNGDNTIFVLPSYCNSISHTDTAQCEKIVSPILNAEVCITMPNDSMHPRIEKGSHILIYKCTGNYIEWGKVYVIETKDSILTRILFDGEEGNIVCHSCNEAYKDFTIGSSDIISIYNISLIMSTP